MLCLSIVVTSSNVRALLLRREGIKEGGKFPSNVHGARVLPIRAQWSEIEKGRRCTLVEQGLVFLQISNDLTCYFQVNKYKMVNTAWMLAHIVLPIWAQLQVDTFH